jgi:phosphatidylserine synthase 2
MEPSSFQDDGKSPPTSPVDDRDAATLSAPEAPEPSPGLNGNPVHWYDADRTEPYTRIEPFQEHQDTSIEFFYKPVTLTALAVALAALGYVATTQDVLEEGRDKRRVYAF